MKRRLLIPDAHAHIGSREELCERLDQKIPTLLNIDTLKKAQMLEPFWKTVEGRRLLIPSYGIHPWRAGQREDPELKEIAQKYPLRGEIGMDSLWCSVPLPVQKQVLKEQLEIAKDQGKPVVLHTKGQEKAVAAQIVHYPNRYLVHWYSSHEGLGEYLNLDCYISVGPDVWWNETVQQAAIQVPLNRILIETDGMAAVRWAYEQAPEDKKKIYPNSLQESLERTLEAVAELRKIKQESLANQINFNFHCFTGKC